MKTQTSIDWLAEQLHDNAIKALVKREITLQQFRQKRDEILQTARQMHREEVVTSYTDGQLDIIEVIMPIPDEIKVDTKDGENYYTQTFETP